MDRATIPSFLKSKGKVLKKKSLVSSNALENLTRQLNSVSLAHNESNSHSVLIEWKQNIKDNNVLYFLNLTNQFAQGQLSSRLKNFDEEFFYTLGKYASPSIYTLLKNSDILEQFDNPTTLHILEGIASSDNHHLFVHMVNLRDFNCITHNDIHQYSLSLMESKAYNTMRCLIETINTYASQQLKTEFVEKIKSNMSRVIEQFDSRMIAIIMQGIKHINS